MTYQSLEGASGICLIYQVVCYHKDENSKEYARTCYEALNKTFLTQKYRGWSPKNKGHFSLVISKLMPDFSAVQLDVAKIISTNTSQRIIREV